MRHTRLTLKAMTVGGLGSRPPRPQVGRGVSFLPETEALVARLTTPPTLERKERVNTLISSLIDAGVWAKLDCLWGMAAADAQAARQNWSQDAHDLTTVNSPTFTADRGYRGNGTTS